MPINETVEIDSQAVYDAATSPEPAPQHAATGESAAEPTPPTVDATGRVHAADGKFAPKVEQPAAAEPAQPAAEQSVQPDNAAHVPSWRLAEVSEARRQAEARAAENERRASEFERQNREYAARLQQLQTPAQPLDMYDDPAKFVDHGVRRAIDPIAQQFAQQREYFSRKDAIREHGAETVVEAYQAFEKATRAGDPRIAGLVQRVFNGPDPFEDIVSWHKREKAMETVGSDPNAWFEAELAKRAADPAFRTKLQGVLAPAAPAQAQPGTPRSVVVLPPSINRASGAAGAASQASISNEDLYAFATAK